MTMLRKRNTILCDRRSTIRTASSLSPTFARIILSNGASLCTSTDGACSPALHRHIDGQDYFWALSEILDSARECIFILDWWLTPELYLRRPPAFHPEWRLDRLLKRKAEEGVKIFVVVYKEVTQTMSMSSAHTKRALEALHPNIAVMRHPDHIGALDIVEFWSHHEKLVVVDNHRACVGGLDICFGRWDTHTHPLADVHPTSFDRTLFPGQDYNNARILDFQKVSARDLLPLFCLTRAPAGR
jgi:phospholipase D1/2